MLKLAVLLRKMKASVFQQVPHNDICLNPNDKAVLTRSKEWSKGVSENNLEGEGPLTSTMYLF